MNYKYLQCNRLKTKEVLGMYLTKEGALKLQEIRGSQSFKQYTRAFDSEDSGNKYKANRSKKKPKKPVPVKNIPSDVKKKIPIEIRSMLAGYEDEVPKGVTRIYKQRTPTAFSNKMLNKAFSQFASVNRWFTHINDAFDLIKKNPKYGAITKVNLHGKYKYYVGKQFINKKRWKKPYRNWGYHARSLYWDNRRFFYVKFAKYLNFFNKELVTVHYDREYVYNKSSYNIVNINLTPNNITIVVTSADGHILSWGTSGTKGFHGHSKHAYIAIEAVALTMYRGILYRKFKNLKLVYRGRRSKIRMRRALSVFYNGEKWKKYKILAVIDMAPLPHNGCKKAKKRR